MNNWLLYLLSKVLFFVSPKFITNLLHKKYFNKSTFKVSNLSIDGAIRINEPKRLILGDNCSFKGNSFIDCEGGIVLGKNVKLGRGVNILSRNNSDFGPVVVSPNTNINDNSVIPPNSLIGGEFEKLNFYSDNKELVFIVGTGRSGTNAIASFINNEVDAVCFHDPFPHISFWTSDFLYGKLSESQLEEKIKFLYNSIDAQPFNLVGQSDQKFGGIIPVLHKLFPHAKFLWVLRNGVDFVNSAYPRGWYRNSEFGYSENINEFFSAQAVPSHMHALNRINGHSLGLFDEISWKEMSAFERCCWYWSYWNNKIESDLNNIPSHLKMKLKLEDLSSSTESLMKFLNLKSKAKVNVTNAAKYTKLSFNDWNEEMKSSFKLHCGNDMNKWYAN